MRPRAPAARGQALIGVPEVSDLRERLRRVPGLDHLLPALAGLAPTFLVGGAVRDLLLEERAVDLDVAVEGDARAVARTVADRLGGTVREHERFGTATVIGEGVSLDLAATRTETYDAPGELPRVEPAPLADDLRRRDFAINAMAVGLRGDDLGHLYDPHHGRLDLDAQIVRVLHDRSFVDDPTRLLRAVRYETRLGFALDAASELLAREAVAAGALATVSGARIRDELMDLLAEPEAPAGVGRLRDLGIAAGLNPALAPDPELVASAALGAASIGADRVLTELAAMLASSSPGDGIQWAAAAPGWRRWLLELHLSAVTRDVAIAAAGAAPMLAQELREREHSPSELRRLLGREPLEALALALALQAPPEPILRWATDLSHVRLEITGDDLVAAGVAPGPAIGNALDGTLDSKLDGIVNGRDEELNTALALARTSGGSA